MPLIEINRNMQGVGTQLGVAIMGAFILWAVRYPKSKLSRVAKQNNKSEFEEDENIENTKKSNFDYRGSIDNRPTCMAVLVAPSFFRYLR